MYAPLCVLFFLLIRALGALSTGGHTGLLAPSRRRGLRALAGRSPVTAGLQFPRALLQ